MRIGNTSPVYTEYSYGEPSFSLFTCTVILLSPCFVATSRLTSAPGNASTLFVSTSDFTTAVSFLSAGRALFPISTVGILKLTLAFSAPFSPAFTTASVTVAGAAALDAVSPTEILLI